MSTLGELLREPVVCPDDGMIPIRTEMRAGARSDSIRDEQVRTLVQQLFFRPESGLVRNVGFTSVEASPQTALLCLDVARAVAAEGRVEVGLIDASFDAVPLERQLRIQSPAQSQVTWPVCSRVWLVPRRNWWCEGNSQTITDQDLAKLCEFMTEFDFSILHCASVSSLTARIGRRCDGLVLVLTANKTRRLAAAQVRDRLRKIQVPLLGTVLAERRFPVPEGLYRSL